MGELDLGEVFPEGGAYKSIQNELWSEIPFFLSTGVPTIDYAIAGFLPNKKGGIPAGRVTELWGEQMAGKSTLLDMIIKEACKIDCAILLCDKEKTHLTSRMVSYGIDPKKVRFIEKEEGEGKKRKGKKPSVDTADITLEEFFALAIEGVQKINDKFPGTHVLVALDSLAMMKTRAQEEGEDRYEQDNMKVRLDKSILLSDVLPKFCSDISSLGATMIFINQIRTKPGISFGDSDYSSGGSALGHACSLRIKLQKSSLIDWDKDPLYDHKEEYPVGLNVRFFIHKNKVGRPYIRSGFSLYFDSRGIPREENLFRLLEERKKITDDSGPGIFGKTGITYTWDGEKIGKGRNAAIRFLTEHPDIADEVERRCFLEEIVSEDE